MRSSDTCEAVVEGDVYRLKGLVKLRCRSYPAPIMVTNRKQACSVMLQHDLFDQMEKTCMLVCRDCLQDNTGNPGTQAMFQAGMPYRRCKKFTAKSLEITIQGCCARPSACQSEYSTQDRAAACRRSGRLWGTKNVRRCPGWCSNPSAVPCKGRCCRPLRSPSPPDKSNPSSSQGLTGSVQANMAKNPATTRAAQESDNNKGPFLRS